jgi:Uma2 family endonuclease
MAAIRCWKRCGNCSGWRSRPPGPSKLTLIAGQGVVQSSPMSQSSTNRAEFSPQDDGQSSLNHPITDDGKPADNCFVEKQQRLLTEPLQSSWVPADGQPFVAACNTGLFFEPKTPAYYPDALLSLGVRLGHNAKRKPNRSYYAWRLGKVPDVAIDIVSDPMGGEDGHRMEEYARRGIPYYVIFDPEDHLLGGVLRVFACREGGYEPLSEAWLAPVGLGLCLWQGTYEDTTDEWLRWCDRDGRVIPSGKERRAQEAQRADMQAQRAELEKQRAEVEKQLAEVEKQHAAEQARRAELEKRRGDLEKQRAEQLRAQLLALGIAPAA